MILINKSTREAEVLTVKEFKYKYSSELSDAVDNYIKSQQRKIYLCPFRIKCHKEYESEFCLSLRWNFNNYTYSDWYIERI